MGQNWIELNGCKLMNEIDEYMMDHDLRIVYCSHSGHYGHVEEMTQSHHPDPEMYPWAASFAPPSCSCSPGTCSCERRMVLHQAIHLLSWDRIKGLSDPRQPGEVVHHQNANKHDARIKNLGKGTRAAHARAHNAAKRKFSPRDRLHTGGFRHHPHQPARVISRPEMIGMTVMPTRRPPMPLSKKARVKQMEERLGEFWADLSAQMAHLDSGLPIPRAATRAAWQAPDTRRLGLTMPRLELSPGGAAFVLLCVKHTFDMEAMSAEVDEPRQLLEELRKLPAVDVAITRWGQVQRLPLRPGMPVPRFSG